MKQIRLEALKLAVGFTKNPTRAMEIAANFTTFVDTGDVTKQKRVSRKKEPATVEPEPIRQRRRRKAA